MRRREFIAGLGAVAVLPAPARAQQAARSYRLGFVAPSGRDDPPIVGFFDELRRGGWIEGQNFTVIPGGLGLRLDRVAEFAEPLLQLAPDVIVCDARAAHVLKRLTRSIPIVTMGEDILADGLVASLSRPDANITGISILSPELDGKRQELLIEAVPHARHIAALVDANVAHAERLEKFKDGARSRGVKLSVIAVKSQDEIEPAIDSIRTSSIEAVNVLATPLFGSYQTRAAVLQRIAALSLPAVYQWPDMADDGGLIGYGPSFTGLYRQRARMVLKVLHGAKPADIPVEQPTRFELVLNLKTAKLIGHEIPASLVLRADRLIE